MARRLIDLGSRALPDVERLIVVEVDADVFQDVELGQMDALQRVGIEPVVGWSGMANVVEGDAE